MGLGIASRRHYEVIKVALLQHENGRCFTEIRLEKLPKIAGPRLWKDKVHSVAKQINSNQKRVLKDSVFRLS